MRKIRTLLLAAFFVALSTSVFAEEAVVTFVSGKVEVQRNGKWVALQKGDSVKKSETISTGFQSEVKLKVMDSVMYLGPVTRVTLEELSSNGKQDNVNVYLKTGTARSQVNHTDNKRVNYQVHTAVAVASCRGTDWTMDDSNNVFCLDGTVAVSSYDIENPPEMDLGDEDEDEDEEEEDVDEADAESQDGEAGEENVGEESGESDDKEADKSSGDVKEDSGKSAGEDNKDSGTEKSGDAGSAGGAASGSNGESEKSNSNSNKNSNSNRNSNDNKNQNSNKSNKKRDTPTSKEGVLVKANQGVKVNNSSEVSAPVNNVEKTASEITSAVSTQSDKEAVATTSAPKSSAEAKETTSDTNPAQSDAAKREELKKTGSVEIEMKLPE